MKTIFGPMSLRAIDERLSRYRRDLRGRSQSCRAAHHGCSVDCRNCSRETQTLQGSRNLPDDCAFLESADDRAGNVAPSFRQQVQPAMSKGLHKWYFEVALIHGVLGIAAEVLGLYIAIVAGTNILPQWLRFNHWKLWMRTEMVLWAVALLGGLATYCAWYVAPFR